MAKYEQDTDMKTRDLQDLKVWGNVRLTRLTLSLRVVPAQQGRGAESAAGEDRAVQRV